MLHKSLNIKTEKRKNRKKKLNVVQIPPLLTMQTGAKSFTQAPMISISSTWKLFIHDNNYKFITHRELKKMCSSSFCIPKCYDIHKVI